MKTQTFQSATDAKKFLYPLFISIIISLFLGYIEEGYYSFKWMLDLGSWFIFFVFVSVIYGVQMILILPVFRFAPNFILTVTRIILIILAVLFLGFVVLK